MKNQSDEAPGFCLKLPGKRLNLTALLYAKKFRAYGYKPGAIDAFKALAADGVGVMEEFKSKSGMVSMACTCRYVTTFHCFFQNYIFIKQDVPINMSDKIEFGKKLLKYGVSLQEYCDSLSQDEIL